MPGNTEEKEKCLEKLNQMQKFIPFLDFMIERISNKNNEISLECQLSKLHIVRSMIAEKNKKYSWEFLNKVEDVIQRLMSKLDIKERYEKSKHLNDSDSENLKTSMATSISIVPSSTSTVSVTSTSDLKPQEFSSSTVDLIMKTLKPPIEQNKITDRDKELLSNPLGPNQQFDVCGKPMETDLDKDLDGYDLTDWPSLSETTSSNTAVDSVPENVTSHDDLLSSSREKLLKSLQSRIFPSRTNIPSSQSPAGNETEKTSDPQITSAFSRQNNLDEEKAKCDSSKSRDDCGSNIIGLDSPHSSPAKRLTFPWKPAKSPKNVLNSLQSKIFPHRTDIPSSLSPAGNETEKTSDPQITSAFSRSQSIVDEEKAKCDSSKSRGDSGSNIIGLSSPHASPAKRLTFPWKPAKSPKNVLNSVQSKIFPHRTNIPSPLSPAGNKTEKTSEPQITSAFSRSQSNVDGQKAKSDTSKSSGSSDKKIVNLQNPHSGPAKHPSFTRKSSGDSSSPGKVGAPTVQNSDVNLKQKLKEKLSTDICEVYRVPGKSVGGSLRSLKEPRKSLNKEENEIFKPDAQRTDRSDGKSHQDSLASEKTGHKSGDKVSHRLSGNSSGGDKRQDSQSSRTGKSESETSGSNKSESQRSDNDQEKRDKKYAANEKKPQWEKMENKSFELDKLNDDELLDFVKENMQSLPHLAKLKSSELRKAVQSSLSNSFAALDAGAVSEISDDSFQDSDDFSSGDSNSKTKTITKDKSETKESHPLASVKTTEIGADGAVRNVKPSAEPGKDPVPLKETGDKTHDSDEVSVDDDNSMNDDDYALKLIEESTPKTYSSKPKASLELPTAIMDDLFIDISSVESFEPSSSPSENRDPRLAKLAAERNKLQNSSDASKAARENWSGRPAANLPKASNFSLKPQTSFVALNAPADKVQRNVQDRFDSMLGKALTTSHSPQDASQHPQPSHRYPNELSNSSFRNPSYFNNDPRRHVNLPPEPRTYAEYKRMKQKEQEKMSQQSVKENRNSNFVDGRDAPSRSAVEKDDGNITRKIQDPRLSGYKDPISKQSNPRSYPPARCGKNFPHSNQWRHSNYSGIQERKSIFEESWDEEYEQAKKADEKHDYSEPARSFEGRKNFPHSNQRRHSSHSGIQERKSIFEESWDEEYEQAKKTEEKRSSTEPAHSGENRQNFPHSNERRHSGHSGVQEKKSIFEESWDEEYETAKKAEENRDSSESAHSAEGRKNFPHSNQKRHSSHSGIQERKSVFEESWDEEYETAKKAEEKRNSPESDELVSPLEKLYRSDDKPKTGRGYGIQNFKIPKKVRKPSFRRSPEQNKKQGPTNSGWKSDPRTEASNAQCVEDSTKKNKESARAEESEKSEISQASVAAPTKDSVEEPRKNTNQPESSNITLVDSVVTEDVPSVKSVERVESSVDSKKTDSRINESESVNSDIPPEETKSNENPESVSVAVPVISDDKISGQVRVEPKTDLNSEKTDALKQTQKSETQMVEGESSLESSHSNETSAGKDSSAPADKNTNVQKEDITQEFVEALIRKSFQSGEGKLLLAQVKLFEEFTRKLNSKKLKTIQKIINSGSGSSSSSEASSDDDKRKKKSKKSEQKSKKRKKKPRKIRKHRLFSSSSSSSAPSASSSSSSSSSSESEESSEKEGKTSTKKSGSSLDHPSTSKESKSKNNESPSPKIKDTKKRSGKRGKQKPNENKSLEESLDESPQREGPNTEPPVDNGAKEPTPKKRGGRTKGKGKTELDRLHDDIRGMFISDGVVTATGRRMCRILKQSGGNMNNLDIVKESAKMVEEEKLKKVQTRATKTLDNSKSQSADTGVKDSEVLNYEEDEKLRLIPRVILQKIDLDNFGYGIKVSEDCVSFRRMKGRNTAIRGAGLMSTARQRERSRSNSPARGVFLGRNKRKYERLRDSKRKKIYRGKKLMDIVKNLPLKMAKMKHLQICARKKEEETTKDTKNPPEKLAKKNIQAVDLTNSELQCYAFEKKRRIYICKLCSHVTRNITGHYKAVHAEHEVLISRLCLDEAKSAKLDSQKNNYDVDKRKGNSTKRKGRPPCNRSTTYRCRMCNCGKVSDLNNFAVHVSTHTGEYRFQCPAEACTAQMHSRENLKFHILAKHHKNRFELYNSILPSYPLTNEGNKLFGFLCSLCHYVQICRFNLETHISIQHNSCEDARIMKINLSSGKRPVKKRMVLKEDSNKTPASTNNVGSGDEENKNSDGETTLAVKSEEQEKSENVEEVVLKSEQKEKGDKVPNATQTSEEKSETMENAVPKSEKKRRRSEDEPEEGCNEGPGKEVTGKKRIFLHEGNAEDVEVTADVKSSEGHKEEEEEVNLEDDENTLDSDTGMEDCVDLKNISNLKGSDIISSMETPETSENPVRSNPENTINKLKVGPLAALLSPNSSEVLYECYVKGCLFSTRAFDLFEKHIKISHWRTKWNGVCEICCPGKDNIPLGQNPFKLLTALNHLKLHARGRSGGGKLSAEDLIMELKLLTPSEECSVDNEDSDSESEGKEKNKAKEQMTEKTVSKEAAYPVKPLLRVRNLLGDRLSTPKADETEVVSLNEDDSSNTGSSTDSSKMFTIENVRSLTDSPAADSEIKIEQVCSLKDLVSKPASELSSGKTILVRSCPTRKIAIRPEPSSLSVDVGTINVVQPPVVGHPVVLSPLSSTSPIRIISTGLSPNPTFTVKPIVVSADGVRLSTPNLMPVIGSSLSPAVSATTVLPVSTSENPRSAEGKTISQKQSAPKESDGAADLLPSKIGVDVEVITCAPRSKSPSSASGTVQFSKNSGSDVEDVDEKDTISPQRFATSPSTGKKSVKDAKIYKEMLTKPKLCHLFKCMGIECSFTCNNENVFTQHIGLHEAQRRLKRNKGIKRLYLRSANKTTRAFYWQQCAYCCDVLSNTNKALSHHIMEEHGHCRYQCGFCFYRAISHCYVEIHQNLAHSQILKTTPRVIYKCKALKKPPSQAAALEKHGRKQSVRPYHCDQCGRKFYITHEFTTHLQTEHQSVTAYTCHICKNLCFKVNRLINHYKLHSYSTYQCAYCLHGTETEKEMVFHLCNFHFSQPAVMYIRALAEGQSGDQKDKLNKKKKHLNNQLESLKVITYNGESTNLEGIVEAEADDEIPENISESSLDLSSIVAELGIYTDSQSSTAEGATPLMKELASIGDKSAKHLSVKNLLPNAQFSSENENGTENCSVLISSGLSIPSDPDNDTGVSIPLGQLPLKAVNVQHKESTPPASHSSTIGSPERNLKLNEIIVNLQHKDKNLTLPVTEEEKAGQPPVKHSSAVHKLPPVVVPRGSVLKYAYPSAVAKKKQDESRGNQNTEMDKNSVKPSSEKDGKTAEEKSENTSTEKQTEEDSIKQPLITSVVSLSKTEFDKESSGEFAEDSIIISDVCSLSTPAGDNKDNSNASGVVINVKSSVKVGSVLKPPIIRLEDFPIGDDSKTVSNKNSAPKVEQKDSVEEEEKKKEPEKTEDDRPPSPDVIILEDEKAKDIVTVTLDSDDEKEDTVKKETGNKSKVSKDVPKPSAENETIRKQMELLRNQIASETDSLLLDEPETEKPSRDLSLSLELNRPVSDENAKTLLSPIEEAICSLNKKLESENQEAQKKVEEEKKEPVEAPRKSNGTENKVPERRRTRFGGRKERTESLEKSDGDDGSKKEVKFRRFKGELLGKDLFICGNDKCNFAADNDTGLKDHLYVCDLSRDSSVLVCPHCSRQVKQFRQYLDHLKYHGEKRFHCGLCPYSSAVDGSVSSHLKQKHKCSVTKILPKESKEGHLVYYPKNYKVEKVDFEVNGYSPGDEDKLPLQSVYQVNVKCAKCPYFTKVRSNMVRHLKIHVKSVETEGVVVVPSTAPTNPVPCLETKERMFDKMTNLAASSQLAQAKDKTTVESLSPEEEAKLPQFVAEQMRYKCCLPDCNYLTIDDGMLKHHIKALHDEINYYSCPHCRNTVHVDVRHVTLDKIGFHLKHHDTKLYKCAHCIYFHYQKNVIEKHTAEKHPDRRYFIHVVREPKLEATPEEEPSSSEGGARVWKCGLCNDFQTPSKSILMDHLLKTHNTKSKYKCKFCSMKGNSYQAFIGHFTSKHPGEKLSYQKVYYSEKVGSLESQSGNSSGADSSNEHFDTTPLWQRGAPRIRHIRGILIEEEEIKTKKSKKASESEADTSSAVNVNDNEFYCPLCTNKKKPFFTRTEDCFRTHLYQELNYQQFACILCGKMFVDKKDFEKHHSRAHTDKAQSLKQTKEDHEIKFWVDQVIAKQRKQMEERKRKLPDKEESEESGGPPKKKKEV